MQFLAEYLKYLDSNDDAYNSYFEWKNTGQLLTTSVDDFVCTACAMLHYNDLLPVPHRSGPLVWNDAEKFCLPKGKIYWP